MASDKNSKPPADICPEKYCFHWVTPGGKKQMSGRPYGSLEEALSTGEGWVPSPHGGCGATMGRCSRLDPTGGDRDWYEPCELELKRGDLPWFYFIPSAEKLVPELRDRYLRESRKLWGSS